MSVLTVLAWWLGLSVVLAPVVGRRLRRVSQWNDRSRL